MIDDSDIDAKSKARFARTLARMKVQKASRERAKIPVPHVALAVYTKHPAWRDPAHAEQLARLLVDKRWPWLPWWVSFTGKGKPNDRSGVRVGGKNGVGPLLEGFASETLWTLHMNRTMGPDNFTSLMLDLDRVGSDAYRMWITCKSVDLPAGKSFEGWLSLAHDLITAIGASHATLGAWPTFDMAIGDTWLTRMVLDTPTADINLGLPDDFRAQIDLLQKWYSDVGRTYARHPRWGTYLHAGHVAAIGGADRIRAEVQPARIDAVGDLTYIQLTDSIDNALTPEAGAKRRALEALMAPILLGAPVPPPAPP
jgi:hypothetical protein